jgi:hypothetical protein
VRPIASSPSIGIEGNAPLWKVWPSSYPVDANLAQREDAFRLLLSFEPQPKGNPKDYSFSHPLNFGRHSGLLSFTL